MDPATRDRRQAFVVGLMLKEIWKGGMGLPTKSDALLELRGMEEMACSGFYSAGMTPDYVSEDFLYLTVWKMVFAECGYDTPRFPWQADLDANGNFQSPTSDMSSRYRSYYEAKAREAQGGKFRVMQEAQDQWFASSIRRADPAFQRGESAHARETKAGTSPKTAQEEHWETGGFSAASNTGGLDPQETLGASPKTVQEPEEMGGVSPSAEAPDPSPMGKEPFEAWLGRGSTRWADLESESEPEPEPEPESEDAGKCLDDLISDLVVNGFQDMVSDLGDEEVGPSTKEAREEGRSAETQPVVQTTEDSGSAKEPPKPTKGDVTTHIGAPPPKPLTLPGAKGMQAVLTKHAEGRAEAIQKMEAAARLQDIENEDEMRQVLFDNHARLEPLASAVACGVIVVRTLLLNCERPLRTRLLKDEALVESPLLAAAASLEEEAIVDNGNKVIQRSMTKDPAFKDIIEGEPMLNTLWRDKSFVLFWKSGGQPKNNAAWQDLARKSCLQCEFGEFSKETDLEHSISQAVERRQSQGYVVLGPPCVIRVLVRSHENAPDWWRNSFTLTWRQAEIASDNGRSFARNTGRKLSQRYNIIAVVVLRDRDVGFETDLVRTCTPEGMEVIMPTRCWPKLPWIRGYDAPMPSPSEMMVFFEEATDPPVDFDIQEFWKPGWTPQPDIARLMQLQIRNEEEVEEEPRPEKPRGDISAKSRGDTPSNSSASDGPRVQHSETETQSTDQGKAGNEMGSTHAQAHGAEANEEREESPDKGNSGDHPSCWSLEELLVDEAGSSNGEAEVGRVKREETMSDGDGDPDSLARKLSSEAETAKKNAGTVKSSSVASRYAPVHRDRMGTIERTRSSSPPLRVDQADVTSSADMNLVGFLVIMGLLQALRILSVRFPDAFEYPNNLAEGSLCWPEDAMIIGPRIFVADEAGESENEWDFFVIVNTENGTICAVRKRDRNWQPGPHGGTFTVVHMPSQENDGGTINFSLPRQEDFHWWISHVGLS
ncbi:hypothetical protein B0T16DRAFT_460924 [Cercophora newfieldiana]|uniref:Uncharacterized protein n=1 Tax=Cercophora newfieldiana TaxID=92897 RepID=A0AA39XV14_9PEZI|nr:hypothetical protein B0T16DRAFT_460924 [Cercophora newfieldiana]